MLDFLMILNKKMIFFDPLMELVAKIGIESSDNQQLHNRPRVELNQVTTNNYIIDQDWN